MPGSMILLPPTPSHGSVRQFPNLYPAVRHPVTRRLAERLSARRRKCCVEPMRKATEGVAAGGYRSDFWRGC
ncbi:hypothetical protein BDZ91DRAFT_237220 [Kalaharituber pfeilii]|nr:hypothetical protein BDZ91DRAFT_237220 [Kalaharituber pfeilii]